MIDTLVIGFGHKARHGKDTAVSTIIDAYKSKYDIRRVAFADALKQEVNEAFETHGGWTSLFSYLDQEGLTPDWVVREENPDMSDPLCPRGKQRKLLQWWGTEYRRAKDAYYWVKKMDQYVTKEKPAILLIPDMRFKNEFYWVKSKGGWTVNTVRVGFQNPPEIDNHASEHQLDNAGYDITISVVDGELADLKRSAIEAFEIILKETYPAVDTDFSVGSLEKVSVG